MGEAIRPDYDEDPERFRLARSVLSRYGPGSDVHQIVAARLIDEQLLPVLDVGCGEGELARFLPAGAWCGLDSSRTLLARAPRFLRRGGLLAVAAPSRDDSPELAGALGRPALTFDAEIAAELLGELF